MQTTFDVIQKRRISLVRFSTSLFRAANKASFGLSASCPTLSPWSSSSSSSLGTLSKDDDDDDCSENVAKKMNLRSFKLNRVYLDPLNMSNAGDLSWS